jgi:hypothetical protein
MFVPKIASARLALILGCVVALGGGYGIRPAIAGTLLEPGQAGEERKQDGERRPKAARDGERRDQVAGVLQELDLKVGTIRIELRGDGAQGAHTYNLANKNVKATAPNGQDVPLSELRPGASVSLVMKDSTDVSAIEVHPPVVFGPLLNIDLAGRKLTLRPRARELPPSLTLDVAQQVSILVGGRAAALGDLQVGQIAYLDLTLDRKSVVAIRTKNAAGAREGARPGAAAREGEGRQPGMFGVVVDVDPAKKTFSLLLGGDEQKIQAFTAAPDAQVKVLFDARPAQVLKVGQLARAVNARLTFAADGKTVTGVEANAPIVRGLVRAVDIKGRQLTVRTDSGDETFPVAENAVVRSGGQDAGLADVHEGMNVVIGLSLDRQLVLGVMVARPAEGR